MPARIGYVYQDARFYADAESGELKRKFLMVLAAEPGRDIVARLLTSRYASLRPREPACFHGDPYPGFFLGVPGGPLNRETWLDLRAMDDLDAWDFERHLSEGRITDVGPIAVGLLMSALACAASADDTTRSQENRIRNALAQLG
jgi:hypothetical protein